MIFHHRNLLRLLTIALISTSASAEIYKQTDENGRTIYSDNPKGTRMEAVDLPAINSQPAIKPRPAPSKKSKSVSHVDYQIAINSPEDGTYIPPGQRELLVTFSVQPYLRNDHSFQAFLNGEPFGLPTRSNTIVLNELNRGEYQLSIAVVDNSGNTLGSSDAVTIYVQRAIKPAPPKN